MKRTLLFAGLSAAMLLTAGCSSTTSRSDVREARHNLRDAELYGDRDDRREARRDYRETQENYRDDHRCGPDYGVSC